MKALKKQLELFSTNRAIRNQSHEANSILKDKISLGDFFKYFSKSNKPRASEAFRTYCMHKASCLARAKLNLSEDFLNFLQDKEYLFSFYEELASQNVSINDLKNSDIYSFFDEYLISLKEVLDNYLKLLDDANVSDVISEAKLEPNEYLLSQYESIDIYLDGFLKSSEVEFFKELSKSIKINIQIELSLYNQSLIKKAFNLDLEPGFIYKLSYLKDSWVAKELNSLNQPPVIQHAGFKSALLEYLAALYLCAKDVRSGINPKNIVIILCDESKASLLKALDVFNYLNIAKGLKDIAYEQKLDALLKGCEYEMSKANTINKAANLEAIKLCEEALIKLTSDEQAKEQLIKQLDELAELASLHEISLLDKLQLIKPLTCAHVDGGEISVIGALEARGLKAQSVIVCDFNDDVVPARVNLQMYLNNKVRKFAGLISDEERENLQRHFYYALFTKASNVRILYVDNEEAKPARFLKHFKNTNLMEFDEAGLIASYEAAIKGGKKSAKLDASVYEDWPKDIEHRFIDYAISYSKLACLERSGAEYFYKYILKISEPRSLNINAALEGLDIHRLLEFADFSNEKTFLSSFKEPLEQMNELNKLIALNALKAAYKLINNQEAMSYEELSIEANLDGIKLVGQLDKYFANGVIIDYKNSSSINNANHEKQLNFYALLLEHLISAKQGDKEVALPILNDYEGFNVYLKSPNNAVMKRVISSKHKDALIESLKAFGDDFKIAKFSPQDAYGYYYLLANKEVL